MKKNICILAFSVALLSSCNFLDRQPIDFGSESSFFKTAEDLKYSVNAFYEYLPTNNSYWGGLYTADTQSDNQSSTSVQNLFYPGNKKTVEVGSSDWNFTRLRGINYFINKTLDVKADVEGDPTLIDHYLGEGYFFRAYDHFRLLQSFGDAPILTQMLPDDADVLIQASKRYPRNEVARFILEDLDKAAALLKTTAPESGRVTKYVALALKSRVALYEATWEKYHAGTCFVPGNSKWVGKEMWPDFAFPSGSAENEYKWFFQQAIDAAGEVNENRGLNADYAGLFTGETAFPETDEVLLARYYLNGIISHSCSAFLKAGGGCNVNRAAVNTYLMQNGLPIYASGSGYQGDKTSYAELTNRDKRLQQSVRPAGFIKSGADTVYFYKPYIYNSGTEKATTGYEMTKWLSSNPVQQVQYKCWTAVPIFRAGECYVNYLEAYYELNGQLDAKCDKYWKALRSRAGVNTDYTKTINATDLDKENDLGIWSKGVKVDKTLYSIRRERRCELLAEGLRLMDLKRWRSLDNMVNYQTEGFNLWGGMNKMYTKDQLDPNLVTQSGVSTYIRPLQLSSTSPAYDGYNFPKQHYTEPIPISQFRLTIDPATGKSTIYQNPGWPKDADGTADYTYDCD